MNVQLACSLTVIMPVISVDDGLPHVLINLTVYGKLPLVSAGGAAVSVNVLFESEDISPRLVGLILSQAGPDILLTDTPLTGQPPLAETVIV